MVEFFDPISNQNVSYHIDKKLVRVWDRLKGGKLAKLNEDRVYLVDGRERTGKSSFVIQQAKYIFPDLTVDNICFTPDEFLEQIRHAKKGSCIIFDEAFRGLSSKSSRSKVNRAIVEALMEVGQRNLVIFIVLPTIFLLEIYAAVFRSECLFHIYGLRAKNASGSKKRAFKIYNYMKKKKLYLRGKTKYFSYTFPKINRAKGRFFVHKTDKFPAGVPYIGFDIDKYLAKKQKAFQEIKKEDEGEGKRLMERNLVILGLRNKFFKSDLKISRWLTELGLPMTRQQVFYIRKQHDKSVENKEKVTNVEGII